MTNIVKSNPYSHVPFLDLDYSTISLDADCMIQSNYNFWFWFCLNLFPISK